jgi:KDO2-lipid IV(A) lauroyltransferase
MPILYLISDFFYLLLFYVVGYRKKVVLQNLQWAFPEKKADELLQIRKKFYRHFTDLIVESVKAFTMSSRFVSKRYQFKNPEVINDLHKKGKSVVFVGAHQANWEWSCSMPLWVDMTCLGAYTRVGNTYFDKVIKKSRTRFGFDGYETTKTIQEMTQNFDNGVQALYLLLSDQSPQVHKTYYWSEFMGVKVPIHTGAEMLAKKFDMAVVNYSVKKIRRGRFEVTLELITENPREFENYEITDRYLAITERNIREQPEYYLWSHKRFKHRDKVPEEWK